MTDTQTQLPFMGVAEQVQRVRAGDVSARELVQMYLARITGLDTQLGSYLCVDTEGALAQADAIDSALAAGQDPGPLTGACIAIKDMIVTKDVTTTAASRILEGWKPPYSATVVDRLKRAGAIMLGKTNMDEFAMGSSNENSAYGVCKNPWRHDCVPGGSSGGSAAAVAAGLCSAALGTDTGGSIRQPASFCGVVGIKPTYGRVSRFGVIAYASSLDQVGPMARTVKDAALVLEAISGVDSKDATSVDAPVPNFADGLSQDLEGLRIGIPKEYFRAGLDSEVESSVRAALESMETLGAEIVEVTLPHTNYAVPAYYLVAPAEASSNLARYDGIRFGLRDDAQGELNEMYSRTRGTGFGKEVKRRIVLGTFALRAGYYDEYYKKAQQVRALIKRDFEVAFDSVDVIASPTSPFAAFGFGDKLDNPMDMFLADVFTLSCNLAGLPGLSVPCGFTDNGRPIGLQLLGKPLDEATLLRAAHAYETAHQWHTRTPPKAPSAPQETAP